MVREKEEKEAAIEWVEDKQVAYSSGIPMSTHSGTLAPSSVTSCKACCKETINKTRLEGGEYPIEYTRQIQSDQPSICLSVTSGLYSCLGHLGANYVFKEL